MALKIGLVVGTGQVTLQRATGITSNYSSQNLKYGINGATINFYQLQPNQWLGSEVVTDLQNAAGGTIGIESAVRAYLDAFIGVQKTV